MISDGRDTSSSAPSGDVKRAIRESDALVYAIGIDCGSDGVPPAAGWHQPSARAVSDAVSVSLAADAADGRRRFRRSRRIANGCARAPIRWTSLHCAR